MEPFYNDHIIFSKNNSSSEVIFLQTDRDTCSSKERERFPQETMRTIERLRLRGTEKSKKSLKKQTGVKDYDNPFWEVLNPHRYLNIVFKLL